MVSILRFPPCADTVAVMSVLLERALRGELRSVAVCHRTADGRDEVILTGAYKVRAENALGAALRMQQAAEQQLEPPSPVRRV